MIIPLGVREPTNNSSEAFKTRQLLLDIIAGSADVFQKNMLLSNTLVHEIPDCDTPSNPIVWMIYA
jgi:hypothetical protein